MVDPMLFCFVMSWDLGGGWIKGGEGVQGDMNRGRRMHRAVIPGVLGGSCSVGCD